VKVLQVIGSLSPRDGGPSTTLPQMCSALAKRGHHVEVATTNLDGKSVLDVPLGEPLLADGFTTTYYPAQHPRSYGTSFPMAAMIRKRIADFDVVHVHSLYLFHTLVASAVCRRRGVPYVIRPHGTLDPYHRSIHRGRKAVYELLVERRNLASAAAIHYTSERERTFAERAGIRTPGYVIPHGIDTSVFDDPDRTDALEQLLPEGTRPLLITYVGRLTEKKGLDVLCQAFARVCSIEPTARLVIAGPDDEGLGIELRRWVDECGIGDRVSMPGIVTGPAKVDLLQRSDVFVLPSRDENFAVSVAEALAARTAVVVTPGVAIHGDIETADAGLVVDRNVEAVSEAVVRLLGDRILRRRLGENGRSLVAHLYSWDRISEQLEDMYVAMVNQNGSPKASGGRRPSTA
jgi:glycosyltransferase involved in cell wall biosynthesis